MNEDGGVRTYFNFFLFNNKDNFITIYSICVCVCVCVCVYSLCIETAEVRGKRSWGDVNLRFFFLFLYDLNECPHFAFYSEYF